MAENVRSVLFVGGPWHGTIREISTGTRDQIPVSATVSSARQRSYRRSEFATVETDGYAAAEIWHYDDLALTTQEGYRLMADAAIRVLIRVGELDVRFAAANRRFGRPTPGEENPRLNERERCVPTQSVQSV